MENDRISYIDELRGIAILGVLMIHVIGGNGAMDKNYFGLTWWMANTLLSLSSVAVPLFIMVSGTVQISPNITNHIDWKKYFKRRFAKVFVPFIFWATIYYIYGCISDGHKIFDGYQYLTEISKGSGTQHIPPHLWFIPLIISLYLLTPVITRFFSSANYVEYSIFFGLTLILGFIIPFISKITNLSFPYNGFIYTAPVMYYSLGFLCHEEQPSLNIRLFLIFLLFLIISGIGTALFTYKLGSLDRSLHGLGSPTTLVMVVALFYILKNGNHRSFQKIKFLLQSIGKLSFGIYLVHVLLLEIVNLVLPILFPARDMILFPIRYVVVLFLSMGLTFFFQRIALLRNLIP